MEKMLTCYVEGTDDKWFAICLDFDLSVQGGSLEEVQTKLHDALVAYRQYVEELPEGERAAFLKRCVPLRLRLKYTIEVLWFAFWKNIHSSEKRHNFVMPCYA